MWVNCTYYILNCQVVNINLVYIYIQLRHIFISFSIALLTFRILKLIVLKMLHFIKHVNWSNRNSGDHLFIFFNGLVANFAGYNMVCTGPGNPGNSLNFRQVLEFFWSDVSRTLLWLLYGKMPFNSCALWTKKVSSNTVTLLVCALEFSRLHVLFFLICLSFRIRNFVHCGVLDVNDVEWLFAEPK